MAKKKLITDKKPIVSTYFDVPEYSWLAGISNDTNVSMSKLLRLLVLEKMAKAPGWAPKIKQILVLDK